MKEEPHNDPSDTSQDKALEASESELKGGGKSLARVAIIIGGVALVGAGLATGFLSYKAKHEKEEEADLIATLPKAAIAAALEARAKASDVTLYLAPETRALITKYNCTTFSFEYCRVETNTRYQSGQSQTEIHVTINTNGHYICECAEKLKYSVDFTSGGFGITDGKPVVVEGTQVTINDKRYAFNGNMWKHAAQLSKNEGVSGTNGNLALSGSLSTGGTSSTGGAAPTSTGGMTNEGGTEGAQRIIEVRVPPSLQLQSAIPLGTPVFAKGHLTVPPGKYRQDSLTYTIGLGDTSLNDDKALYVRIPVSSTNPSSMYFDAGKPQIRDEHGTKLSWIKRGAARSTLHVNQFSLKAYGPSHIQHVHMTIFIHDCVSTFLA